MIGVIAHWTGGADARVERMLGHEWDAVVGYEGRELVLRLVWMVKAVAGDEDRSGSRVARVGVESSGPTE